MGDSRKMETTMAAILNLKMMDANLYAIDPIGFRNHENMG